MSKIIQLRDGTESLYPQTIDAELLPLTNLDEYATKEVFGAWYMHVTQSTITGTKPDTTEQGLFICKPQDADTIRQWYITAQGEGTYTRYYTKSTGVFSAWTNSTKLSGAQVTFTLGTYTRNITIRKLNGMVQLSGVLSPGVTVMKTLSSGITIATLPDEYRPKDNLYIPAQGKTTSTWASAAYKHVLLYVGTDGKINLNGNTEDIQACSTIQFSAMFIAS